MLNKTKLLGLMLILSASIATAQSDNITMAGNVPPRGDTAENSRLLTALNGLLSQTDKPYKDNPYILKTDLLETAVLLDEFKDIGNSNKYKDAHFYKGYLTNQVHLNDSDCIVQVSYIGVNEGIPLTRACFKLLAKKRNNQYYFRSPLLQNSSLWEKKKIGNVTLHFKKDYNKKNANKYFNMVNAYDKKLEFTDKPTEFYCCDNYHEVLQLIGVEYKSDYTSIIKNSLSSAENDQNLVVNGYFTPDFTEFDPHDLWHARLHKVIPVSIINKPVDEGTAFINGGSWGLSWEEILSRFKKYAVANPTADWLALYNESTNYDKGAKFPLNVDYTINALIVEKLEKEKGMGAVKELLSCGRRVDGNENYFKVLEKTTGITKADFNKKVWELINAH